MSGSRRDGEGIIARTVATLAIAFVLSRLWPGQRGDALPALSGDAPRPGAPAASARRSPPGTAPVGGEEAPTEMPVRTWLEVAKGVYTRLGEDRITSVAAGVTFYGLLAIFPAVAAFVSVFGLVADPGTITDQLNALGGVMPGGALDIIGEQVNRIASQRGALGFGFLIGLGASVWSANAGMKAVLDALNVAYGEHEKRSFIRLNLVALTFTLGAFVLVVALFGAVVVVPVLFGFIGFGGVGSWLVSVGRWPVMLIVLLLGLAVLYRFGPSRTAPRWRWVTPGSLLAGIGWIVFSGAFTWYVSSFGSYNATYGSLGAAIGFMTWIWLSTTIVLVGAELNAETEGQAGRA